MKLTRLLTMTVLLVGFTSCGHLGFGKKECTTKCHTQCEKNNKKCDGKKCDRKHSKKECKDSKKQCDRSKQAKKKSCCDKKKS